MTNYQQREAFRMAANAALEAEGDDELNSRARRIRAENIRRAALAA